MTTLLTERISNLNSSEIEELEEFAEFLIFKRSNNNVNIDDILAKDLTKLISTTNSFKWLESSEEDVYSPTDGVPVQW